MRHICLPLRDVARSAKRARLALKTRRLRNSETSKSSSPVGDVHCETAASDHPRTIPHCVVTDRSGICVWTIFVYCAYWMGVWGWMEAKKCQKFACVIQYLPSRNLPAFEKKSCPGPRRSGAPIPSEDSVSARPLQLCTVRLQAGA